ncbi:MAG: TauD/TfdA family dioxygenase, partial [Hyphomicrobiales bacterium]|nr:TauD/TfdA family dioxygenase [Hyphomicrobiales bacterium]
MIDVKPLTGCIGAEVFDADVSDARQTDVLMDAFATHAVIVIRDRNITPEQQLAFAKRIGDINVNRFFTSVPGNPEIAMVLKEPDQERAIGERWHTDHSYDIAPAMCSMLHAIETPEIGGDTVFASMYASFDALSDGLKTTLRGLKAWHSSRHVFGS